LVGHRSVKPSQNFYDIFMNNQEHLLAKVLGLDDSSIVCYKFIIEEIILN